VERIEDMCMCCGYVVLKEDKKIKKENYNYGF